MTNKSMDECTAWNGVVMGAIPQANVRTGGRRNQNSDGGGKTNVNILDMRGKEFPPTLAVSLSCWSEAHVLLYSQFLSQRSICSRLTFPAGCSQLTHSAKACSIFLQCQGTCSMKHSRVCSITSTPPLAVTTSTMIQWETFPFVAARLGWAEFACDHSRL